MALTKAAIKNRIMALANSLSLRPGAFGAHVVPPSEMPPSKVQPSKTPVVSVFYTSSVGSLGDAAMGYSVISQIQDRLPEARINLLIHLDSDAPYFEEYGVNVMSMEGYFDVFPKKAAMARIGAALAESDALIVCGADVLDGGYMPAGSIRKLYLGKVAEAFGAKAHVVGFSFSDRADGQVKSFLRSECQQFDLICRDPKSAERLSAVMEREVPHSADLAFLLPLPDSYKTPQADAAAAQVAAWKAEGRGIMVLNANPLSYKKSLPGVPLATSAQTIATAVSEFCRTENCAVLMLTHDNRPAHSDAEFMAQIEAHLDADLPRYFVPETVQPTDIKKLCSLADIAVTGRMHLGIAALGTGTPAVLADYQGKVMGLLSLFDAGELRLDLKEAQDPARFTAQLAEIYANRAAISDKITAHLPTIKDLSRRNLARYFDDRTM